MVAPLLLLLAVLLSALPSEGLRSPLNRRHPSHGSKHGQAGRGDTGEPLHLTPLIEAGELQQAREQSRVFGLPGAGANITSHAGYLTVNKDYNSNMFFWFFECKESPQTAPILLWLQGGPGAPSLYGLFMENGPFSADLDLNLVTRDLSWTNTHNMLYIDNPVGTGFSFTEDDAGYAQNQEDVARDLYSALTQFFTTFEMFRDNDFYVTGESYAGKYVPAISYKIHTENPTAAHKINLKGMVIGDGLVDPINQLDYGDFLYNIGLVDANQRQYFHDAATQTAELIKQGDILGAFSVWDVVTVGMRTSYPTYFKNATGFDYYYNYLLSMDPSDGNPDPFVDFLDLPATRASIHVGSKPFNDGVTVADHLILDMLKSTKPMVAAVLDGGYQVMIYSGQLDVIVPYTSTEQWLATMDWHGAQQYRDAERYIWREQGEIAGYVRVADNLHEVFVRNSGHMVPMDQPEWTHALITRFTGTDGGQGRSQ